jgi:DNA-binding MarR family transcriptional regulator
MTRKADRHDLSVWFDGSEIAERDDTLITRSVKHNGHEELTLLEVVLQVHGVLRKCLEPIHVTPLQAGVMLYLSRHADATLTDAAAMLGLRLPTLSVVIKILVRKQWVTKRRSATDSRAVCLSLSRRGETLA